MKQRKLFATREFDFKDEGLFVREKNLTSSHETVISYEDIAINNLSRRKKIDTIIIVVTAFFGLMSIIFLIAKISSEKTGWGEIIVMFGLALFSGIISYVNCKREVIIPLYISGGIILFERIPNKNTVDQFILDLKSKINNYLINKYATIDHDLPSEGQLNNLIHLRERKVIDDDKFRQLKESLLKGKSQSEIGFRK
ncbi:hypothetical protein [Roseivirga sp.]|uniref:hypothetical protein n=1 Tax=Roseivirga sp. TaxID=1964215 RepID=UPI002B26DCE4|nr:hypothetical protein [Roseivirga sp.]